MSAAPLTPRQQVIVDLLTEGPRTMRELVASCGYQPGDRAGHGYVSMTLGRLSERGYSFHNFRPPGSHRGGFYVLMARPRPAAEQPQGERRCDWCGSILGQDHSEDRYCSRCERGMVSVELECMAPPSLFDAEVAS